MTFDDDATNETRKPPLCWPYLLGGLVGLGLIGYLAAYTGENSAKSMIETAQSVAQGALDEGQHVYAKATVGSNGVITLTGDAPSAEARTAACDLAKQSLQERGMFGLPGIVSLVRCDLTVAGAPVEPATPVPASVAVNATPAAVDLTKDAAAQDCQARLTAAATSQAVGFRKNSADIVSGQAVLDQVAAVAKTCGAYRIEVAGHTDVQGADDLNMRLSQSRAEAVVAMLTGKGVAASQLSAKGYGETKPLDTAMNSAAHAKNRRIEFVITSAQ